MPSVTTLTVTSRDGAQPTGSISMTSSSQRDSFLHNFSGRHTDRSNLPNPVTFQKNTKSDLEKKKIITSILEEVDLLGFDPLFVANRDLDCLGYLGHSDLICTYVRTNYNGIFVQSQVKNPGAIQTTR